MSKYINADELKKAIEKIEPSTFDELIELIDDMPYIEREETDEFIDQNAEVFDELMWRQALLDACKEDGVSDEFVREIMAKGIKPSRIVRIMQIAEDLKTIFGEEDEEDL